MTMMSKVSRALLPAVAALTMLVSLSAMAGGFRLEPGAAVQIDTGERQNYTTITITNPDATPGRLALDAPIGRTVEVPARSSVELYGAYGRRTVNVTNAGSSRLEIVTRYMETPRWP